MIALSFLPAVTTMIYDMELQKHLQGVAFESHHQALTEKPIRNCFFTQPPVAYIHNPM